jgi:uncharacterized membrane protein YbhN (UPF0104 family)
MPIWEENKVKRLNVDYRINKLSFIFLIISLIIFGWIVWNYRELFSLILEIEAGYFIILVVLFAIVQLVNGYKVFMIVRFFGIRIKPIDWIGLPYITSYLNYLPVNAGTGVMAIFLKKKYGLPYTKSVSISGTLLLLQMLCFSTAGLLLMGLIRISKGYVNGYAVGGFLFIFLGVIGLGLLPVRIVKGESRIANWIKSALLGFDDLRRDYSLILRLMLNSYLQLALMGLIIYVTFMSLGLLVSYLDGLLLGVVTSVSKYQFLFPGLLGFREMFIASMTKMVQGSFSDGIIVAVTDRVISGVVTIFLGNIFVWMLIKRLKFS